MSHVLITSGPTRQYIDPVRYISNGSSGQMGKCLAEAALAAGHQVTIVSGPVGIAYPKAAKLIQVTTTEEMLAAAIEQFPDCQGVIAAAAPCDYKPAEISTSKIKKSSGDLTIRFVETPDILAALGRTKKPSQWSVGFALETENEVENAKGKLERKNCDLIVLNDPSAIDSPENRIQIISADGSTSPVHSGSKTELAKLIVSMIENFER
jgi:phosphopantothenoylcysteine decarboxylase/phosphopantothenate--cysteine ligase